MRFQCPFCRGIVAVDNSDLGIDVQCGHCNEIVTVPCSRVATGAVIADFIILQELGRGGMGIVYLAHQMSLDRPAALKVLSENYVNNAEFVVGFIKEARAAAKLNHPHIVQAYAVGEDEGIFYFAMENIDGETMKQVLKREQVIACDKALSIIQQIAEALDYAWKEQRLIHRDIKPDNIMLTSNGRAKLADLGLARVAGDIDDSEDDEVMGTPQYISPEHLTGAPMDVRSDIYSLGATFYHFVTGRFPFEGRTGTEIARKHLEESLVPPNRINSDIPESVSRIIEKMMAKNPKMRYQDAEELVDDLRMARRGKQPLAATSSSQNIPPLQMKTKTLMRKSTLKRKTTHSGGHHISGVFPVPTTTGPLGGNSTTTSLNTRTDIYNLKRMHQEQARKRLITLLVGTALVIIIGGLAAFIVYRKKESSRKQTVQTVVDVPVAGNPDQPKTTAYTMKAEQILALAKANPQEKKEIHRQCEEFFNNFPMPKYLVEEQACQDLMELFIPLDEAAMAFARTEWRKKHMEMIADRKRVQEEAEELARQRVAEELAKKQADERRKQAEAQRVARLEKSVRLMRERVDSDQAMAIYRMMELFGRDDYKGAEELFPPLIKEYSGEADKEPALKEIAHGFIEWASKMEKLAVSAEKIHKMFTNGGTALAGNSLEFRGALWKVKEIRNGVLTGVDESRTVNIKLEQLVARQYLALLKKAVTAANEDAHAFAYSLAKGDFAIAKNLASDEYRSDISKIAVLYFQERLKRATSSERAALQNQYGRMEEFKVAEQALKKK